MPTEAINYFSHIHFLVLFIFPSAYARLREAFATACISPLSHGYQEMSRLQYVHHIAHANARLNCCYFAGMIATITRNDNYGIRGVRQRL